MTRVISAEALPWLLDAGADATAILALLGLFALLIKTRPAKWLWRTLVKRPVTGWLQVTVQSTIQAELEPVHAKLEATAQALVLHMDDEVQLRRDDQASDSVRQQEMDDWRAEIREDIGELKDGLGVLHARLDSTLAVLAAGNPEVHPGALDPGPSDD